MASRDLASNINATASLDPQLATATADGAGVVRSHSRSLPT